MNYNSRSPRVLVKCICLKLRDTELQELVSPFLERVKFLRRDSSIVDLQKDCVKSGLSDAATAS